MQRSRSRAISGLIGIGFSNVRFGKVMRAEPRLVAGDGYRDAGCDGRLDQAGALGHLHLTVVHGERHELSHVVAPLPLRSRGGTCPPASPLRTRALGSALRIPTFMPGPLL